MLKLSAFHEYTQIEIFWDKMMFQGEIIIVVSLFLQLHTWMQYFTVLFSLTHSFFLFPVLLFKSGHSVFHYSQHFDALSFCLSRFPIIKEASLSQNCICLCVPAHIHLESTLIACPFSKTLVVNSPKCLWLT